MPLNTVQAYLKGLLDGLAIPGNVGNLEAYITPPDPRDDPPPAAYIWPASGDEKRQAMPRGNPPGAGWKTLTHSVHVYLTWFNAADDPNADSAFPAVIDTVMTALRSAPNPVRASDPYTGQVSDLVDIGEQMTWDYGPVHAVADQRWLRYDCLITVTVTELIQA